MLLCKFKWQTFKKFVINQLGPRKSHMCYIRCLCDSLHCFKYWVLVLLYLFTQQIVSPKYTTI